MTTLSLKIKSGTSSFLIYQLEGSINSALIEKHLISYEPLDNGYNFIISNEDNVNDFILKIEGDIKKLQINKLNTSNDTLLEANLPQGHSITDASYMFYNCTELDKVNELFTDDILNMNYMFKNCSKLSNFNFIGSGDVLYTKEMFYNCNSLKTIPNFDIANSKTTESMFYGCTNLVTVPKLDLCHVLTMEGMFEGCTSLESIPKFDIRRNTSLERTFKNCIELKEIPLIDTTLVTNLDNTFEGCTNLKKIPDLNIGKVSYMNSTFERCISLKNIPHLNTEKVISMNRTFCDCSTLQTISDLNFDNVMVCNDIFTNCGYLETVKIKNIGLSIDFSYSIHITYSSINYILNSVKKVIEDFIIKFNVGTVGAAELCVNDVSYLNALKLGWKVSPIPTKKRFYNYSIEYYFNTIKEDSLTEHLKAEAFSTITEYPNKSDGRYKIDKVLGFPLVLNQDNKVAKVFYKLIDTPFRGLIRPPQIEEEEAERAMVQKHEEILEDLNAENLRTKDELILKDDLDPSVINFIQEATGGVIVKRL